MPKFTASQKQIIFFVFIILTVIPLHWHSFFMGPTSIHLWAAADWYSLALGFLDNGMDFSHPQVNQLNLQFPGSLPVSELQGITSVDFPINPYLVAWSMKLLGTESPSVYRGYTLLLSLLGLFFLFKAVKIRTQSFWLAAFVVSFVRFQPSYAYYMDGFMPTQNALSMFFIGVFFIAKYSIHKTNSSFIGAVFFFTIAGLMRMPFAIPLIALGGTFIITSIYNKKFSVLPVLTSVFGLSIILLYFLYNRGLSMMYGSVFLNELMPPRNLNDFVFYWIGGIVRNSFSILPFTHILILVVIVVLWVKQLRSETLNNFDKGARLFFGVLGIGVFLYSILMARQLWTHDYYFNDFFLPALVLFLLWVLGWKLYPIHNFSKLFIVLFVLAAFQTALFWQKFAYNAGVAVRPDIESSNSFIGADTFLDTQNIPSDAILLVVGSYAPGIPGNATRRKCFGVRVPESDLIEEALHWPFDYIVTVNSFEDEVLEAYPNWTKETESVASNGKITISKLSISK